MLECEQVVARLDARSAVADDVLGHDAVDVRGESRPQIFRRTERAVLVDVPLEKITRRAGDVSRNGIHWFELTAIALRSPRVEQPPVCIAFVRRYVVDPDRHVVPGRRVKLGPVMPGAI